MTAVCLILPDSSFELITFKKKEEASGLGFLQCAFQVHALFVVSDCRTVQFCNVAENQTDVGLPIEIAYFTIHRIPGTFPHPLACGASLTSQF